MDNIKNCKETKNPKDRKKCRWNHGNHRNDKNWILPIGPCFCAKTYLMMNTTLSSELQDPDRKMKLLTRSAEQNFQYDTQENVNTNNECKDYSVFFDVTLDQRQNFLLHISPRVNMKQLTQQIRHNNSLSYLY